MTAFPIRRVVTAVEPGGARFLSDGPPPLTVATERGFGVSELLWLDGPPADVDAGRDRDDGSFPLEPPPGGLSARLIRMPPAEGWLRVAGDDDDRPGMHATDTLDLMTVIDGEIVLGLADDEVTLGAGDVVVQRGTPHRWRVVGDRPCTYLVTMLRPGPSRPSASAPAAAAVLGQSGLRRIVTGGGGAVAGEAPDAVRAGGTVLIDLWHTMGPLAAADQGGDPGGSFALEPAPGGISFRSVELAPGPVGDAHWHTTSTIDLDVIVSGRMGLELPGGARVDLSPGDSVVQRGTEHRWVPLGEDPARMVSVMVAVPG